MQYSIRAALLAAQRELTPVCGEEAALEARELTMLSLGIADRAAFAAQMGGSMDAAQQQALRGYVARRLKGEPLQYILGFWEFMGLKFKTDARALIPRQDTETLCEHALALIARRGYKSCLDICAGSGCIGISLNKLGGVNAALADISPAALELCAENAAMNSADVQIIKSDMFAGISGKYDIIVSNPPYLSAQDMLCLQRELEFEPRNALYGGQDGLDFYKRIACAYRAHLNAGGALLLEVGAGQAQQVAAMLGGARIAKDVLGIERVVIKE